MHSRTPPMEEARQLYTGPARLSERLCESGGEPLVVWDVGLGGGANAMAAIACHETQDPPLRDLHIISFENDLDPLRLAFRRKDLFPYLDHGGPEAILRDGSWQSGGLRWTLLKGDFFANLEQVAWPPDFIFYDMFSAKTTGEAWTQRTFQRLHALSRGRRVELFTYTCSTASRVAMLSAGFWVAQGCSIGEKTETTIALTPEAVRAHHALLGEAWVSKWRRSTARYPADLLPAEYPGCEAAVLSHPQFRENLSAPGKDHPDDASHGNHRAGD